MPIARVISKGLDIFEQAPEQVKKQIEEGDEQGRKYLEGKQVKKQEADQLIRQGPEAREIEKTWKEQEDAARVPSPGYYEDAKRLSEMRRDTIKSESLGKPGRDPYTKEALSVKGYGRFAEIAPPDLNQAEYEEVGYKLPGGMLTDAAKETDDHWFAGTTAHVRRDTKDGALRVFEIQSDPQNQLSRSSYMPDKAALDAAADKALADIDPMDRAGAKQWLRQFYQYPEGLTLDEVTVLPKSQLDIVKRLDAALEKSPKPKLSPYNIKWAPDIINRQFVDAQNSGLDKVDFLISPGGDYMKRSEKVQTNYETRVRKQIETLAKKLKGPNGEKATVEMVTSTVKPVSQTNWRDWAWDHGADYLNVPQDRIDSALGALDLSQADELLEELHEAYTKLSSKGDSYLRVNLPKTAAGVVAAFSVPAFAEESEESKTANLGKRVGKAVTEGAKPSDVFSSLQESGYDLKVIQQALGPAVKPKVDQMRADGVPDQEILHILQGIGIVPSVPVTDPGRSIDEALGFQESEQTKAVTEPTEAPDPTDLDVQTLDPIGGLDPDAPMPEGLQQKQEFADVVDVVMGGNEAMRNLMVDEDLRTGTSVLDTDAGKQVVKLRNIHSNAYELAHMINSGLGDETSTKRLKDLRAETNNLIIGGMTELGYEVHGVNQDGDVIITNPNTGEREVVDESFFDTLAASGGEIAGAYTAYKIAARFGAGALAKYRPGHPYLTGAAMVAGGLATSAGGASVGRGVDMLRNAMDVRATINQAELIEEMKRTGAMDILLGSGIEAIVKTVKLGTKVPGASVRGLRRLSDLVAGGNKEGALTTIKDTFNLTDEQAIKIVSDWEALNKTKILSKQARESGRLTAKDSDAVLGIIGETVPGGEQVVKAAAEQGKFAGSKLAAAIDTRAKDINKQIANITNDKVGAVVQDELVKYQDTVRQGFASTKQLGIDLMQDADYNFDFRKVSLYPALKAQVKQIHNKNLRADFYTYLDRIGQLGGDDALMAIQKQAQEFGAEKGLKAVTPKITPALLEKHNPLRSFENLLELRKVVNELRADTRFKNIIDFKQMDATTKAIDAEISRAARDHMPNGQTWLKEWKAANVEYSKMKGLERNWLHRIATGGKVSPESLVKAVTKRMQYIDPKEYQEVLGAIPPKYHKPIEGAVLRQLTEKHTVGTDSGLQALHLPNLAEELANIRFTSPEVRDLKRMVQEFAKVYKNDPHLLVATGSMPLPKFQAYLTADPVVRLKYEFASSMFNAAKSRMPMGTTAGRAAVVNNLARILDNPLDAKASKEILAALPNDPELKTQLHQLAIEFAKRGEKAHYGKVPIYRVAKPGQYGKTADTSLGKGLLHYTDKATADRIAKETGAKVTEVYQLHTRIATPEDVATLIGREPVAADYRNPDILRRLEEQGLSGLAVEDKVLIFK